MDSTGDVSPSNVRFLLSVGSLTAWPSSRGNVPSDLSTLDLNKPYHDSLSAWCPFLTYVISLLESGCESSIMLVKVWLWNTLVVKSLSNILLDLISLETNGVSSAFASRSPKPSTCIEESCMGIHFQAPNGRRPSVQNTKPRKQHARPKDNHSLWPTAGYPSDPSRKHASKRRYSMDNHVLATKAESQSHQNPLLDSWDMGRGSSLSRDTCTPIPECADARVPRLHTNSNHSRGISRSSTGQAPGCQKSLHGCIAHYWVWWRTRFVPSNEWYANAHSVQLKLLPYPTAICILEQTPIPSYQCDLLGLHCNRRWSSQPSLPQVCIPTPRISMPSRHENEPIKWDRSISTRFMMPPCNCCISSCLGYQPLNGVDLTSFSRALAQFVETRTQ